MPAVGVRKFAVMVRTGMMRVELHRSFHNAQAVLPVTRVSDHDSEDCRGRCIHAIQREGAIRGCTESLVSFWKNNVVATAEWAKWLLGADATARCAAARARPNGSGLGL